MDKDARKTDEAFVDYVSLGEEKIVKEKETKDYLKEHEEKQKKLIEAFKKANK